MMALQQIKKSKAASLALTTLMKLQNMLKKTSVAKGAKIGAWLQNSYFPTEIVSFWATDAKTYIKIKAS